MASGSTAGTEDDFWRDAGPSEPALELESVWSIWSRSIDHIAVYAALALFAIGVVLAFAASPALADRVGVDAPFAFAWRHLFVGLPAFAVMLALSMLDARGVRRLGSALGLVGLAALALLPILGADFDKAAQRWYSIAGLSVQPSEFLKPGLIVMCGWLLTALNHADRGVARLGVGASFALTLSAVALLMIQPDYGQSALILTAWAAMFYVAGGSVSMLIVVGALGVAALAFGYAFEPHVAARIDGFLGAVEHPQIETSAAAIARGGWFGVGLGEGVVKSSLPDAHSDFILAVAAEEYGFALVALILILYGVIVLRALWRLGGAEVDPLTRIVGAGLAFVIGVQAMMHVAVVAGVAPATGVTLPFVSYGGSSLVASGATLGLLLALTRRRPIAD